MRFATAPFSLAVQPFKAIRWTREAFGPVITTKLTILIIFSMTRGNGTARNGAGSPTPDRHHAADTEWDSTEPECYSSAARDPHISAILGNCTSILNLTECRSGSQPANPRARLLYTSSVALHLIVSSTAGHPARTPLRKYLKIGQRKLCRLLDLRNNAPVFFRMTNHSTVAPIGEIRRRQGR